MALSWHNKDVVILYLYWCEVFKQDEVGWHQTECLMHEQVRRKKSAVWANRSTMHSLQTMFCLQLSHCL